MRRTAVIALTIALLSGPVAALAGGWDTNATLDGQWSGTYTLGGPSRITVRASGARAWVALDAGHAGLQLVRLERRGDGVRFRLPGRPASVLFDARLRGGRLVGTATQGTLHGAFTLKRGATAELEARGFFGSGADARAVVDDPYGPPRLLDLPTGRVRGLFPAGDGFSLGSGWSTTAPSTGMARFTPQAAVVEGRTLARRPLRQLEVRFRSAGALLAGTLTIPSGPGRHPAVAFVSGSGPTLRAYLPDLTALLVDRGVAVLTYDKRGNGQSGGSYPGESPTASTIDVLARDAAAAARFVAAQPEVDPARVGLAGHSQAGWIMPLAATRERAIRFLLSFSGPSVTADEVDLFQNLTGEGERHAATVAEAERQVLARGPSGVDPMPWIRRLAIPSLWVYGALDQHVPAKLSTRLLEPLATDGARDVTVQVYPGANHALVETQTGLTSEMLRSDTFAPGLFAAVGDWLRAHHLGG